MTRSAAFIHDVAWCAVAIAVERYECPITAQFKPLPASAPRRRLSDRPVAPAHLPVAKKAA